MSKNDFEPLDEDIQWFDEPDTSAWARGDGSGLTGLFAYPGATAPDPAVVEARRLTAQRAIAVCQIHFEHSLNFLGQRVGRATHASPWHPCSIGDAIHEGMADV